MVIFNEIEHSYKNIKNEQYISSTTLIHKYVNVFPAEFMSCYKALERIDKNFTKNKGKYLKHKKADVSMLMSVIPDYIDKDVLDVATKIILKEWKKKNDDSKVKGTAIHLKKEKGALDKDVETFEGIPYKVNQQVKYDFSNISLDYYKDLKDGYHTELLLWNHDFKIAGMSDVVIIETDRFGQRWVSIVDFKTNKEIKMENRWENMLYPLEKFPDSNYHHYTLQLSLYCYMLECMGFKIKHLRLIWIRDTGEEIPYVLDYVKQDVINMIEHYNSNK